MNGSVFGNIIGILYYIMFLLLGIGIITRLLKKENLSIAFRILIGSIAGTVAMQWFPLLFSFFFGFTILSHILALFLLLLIYLIIKRKTESLKLLSKENPYSKKKEWLRFIKENPCIILIGITFLLFFYFLITHTIPVNKDGSFHTGQATFGDMSMHLGFITSLTNQKIFPPEYSIFPGTRLSYPFLCDSISSSIYLFGSSLTVAYIFPMLVAILQAFCGLYCFIKFWFKKSSVAFVAFILFFFNGGLGFIYYTDIESIKRNFTDFYYTPTSLVEMNVRIPQIVANMLLPQRATLFGWAILFPLLAFLLYSIKKRSKKCFIIAGIFAGALPMIHTHSFLALGLICIMWLFYDLDKEKEKTKSRFLRYYLYIGILFFVLLQKANLENEFANKNGIKIIFVGLFILFGFFINKMIPIIKNKKWKPLLETWGYFLIIVMILALPQLLYWTFGQASGDGFLRSHFNWSNVGDSYIWFYLKNLGVAFLLLIPAYFLSEKKDLKIASPFLLIWFIAELVVFQPNEYDNNKLLFVGLVFICGLVANFTVKLFQYKWPKILKGIVFIGLLFFGTISALLTLGREYVSDYELYSAASVKACEYIEKNLPADSVILTASNHNNSVASLTGRNIVCGSGIFLNFHGINYAGREQELALMYEDPVGNINLYDMYGVSYIYISDYEYSNYQVNEAAINEIALCIYNTDNVKIYQLKD